MSRQRRDREAFEAYVLKEFGWNDFRLWDNDAYRNEAVQDAYVIWQACAAHYAPKLTVMEAADVAVKSLVGYVLPIRAPLAAKKVMTALRAAGVRFKEEA